MTVDADPLQHPAVDEIPGRQAEQDDQHCRDGKVAAGLQDGGTGKLHGKRIREAVV